MRVVLDANVVAAGVVWRGESHLCLVKLARRQFIAFATSETLAETQETTIRLIREKAPAHKASALLEWYLDTVLVVTPAPLGKQRSRDQTDDAYLACALAAGAKHLVTYDHDLLSLEKPFGIEIARPSVFLRELAG